jgi:hypothetical protein
MRSGSRPRQQKPLPEPSPSLWRAISTSLPIVVALILLPTIAFASPPDPSWIAGIYDGADGDDIVTLIYETAGVEAASTRPVPPLPRSSEVSIVSSLSTIHGLPACQFTRAPPASPALIFYGVRSGLQFLARFPASSVTQRHSLSTTCCPRRIEEASGSDPLDSSLVPRESSLLGRHIS